MSKKEEKKEEKVDELAELRALNKVLAAERDALEEMVVELRKPPRCQRVIKAEAFGGAGVDVCAGCLHVGGGMARGACADCKVVVKYEPTKFSPVEDLLEAAGKARVNVELGREKNLIVCGGGPVADALVKHEAAVVRKLRGL
jgi:hypothetical protein